MEIIFYLFSFLFVINTILMLIPGMAPFTAIGLYAGIAFFVVYDAFVQAVY